MRANFIEVWHDQILLDERDDHFYLQLLSQKEREKAATFSRRELQKKFIKTRAVLRSILSSYTSIEPQHIEILTGAFGKPFLADSNLHFNLSHSANKWVVVVSNFCEIGVDLEQSLPRKHLSGLVNKCFSEEEQQYWQELPEDQKTEKFFQLWVRKEAFVKAVGRGIALGLSQCVINPDKLSCFLSIPPENGLPQDWTILDVQLEKLDACVIVHKSGVEFEYKQFDLNKINRFKMLI